jgi:hypothetical protein
MASPLVRQPRRTGPLFGFDFQKKAACPDFKKIVKGARVVVGPPRVSCVPPGYVAATSFLFIWLPPHAPNARTMTSAGSETTLLHEEWRVVTEDEFDQAHRYAQRALIDIASRSQDAGCGFGGGVTQS